MTVPQLAMCSWCHKLDLQYCLNKWLDVLREALEPGDPEDQQYGSLKTTYQSMAYLSLIIASKTMSGINESASMLGAEEVLKAGFMEIKHCALRTTSFNLLRSCSSQVIWNITSLG